MNDLPGFDQVVRVKTKQHDRIAAYRVRAGDVWYWQIVNFESWLEPDDVVYWNPVDGDLRDTIKSENIMCIRSGSQNIPIAKGDTSCKS